MLKSRLRHNKYSPVRNSRGVGNSWGEGKSLKLNSRGGHNKRGGLVKCPTNTAPYILADILKLFPSSSLNTTIISVTFRYSVSDFDGNFSLSIRSSSNTNSKSGLNDAILDQI